MDSRATLVAAGQSPAGWGSASGSSVGSSAGSSVGSSVSSAGASASASVAVLDGSSEAPQPLIRKRVAKSNTKGKVRSQLFSLNKEYPFFRFYFHYLMLIKQYKVIIFQII